MTAVSTLVAATLREAAHAPVDVHDALLACIADMGESLDALMVHRWRAPIPDRTTHG